MRTRVLLLGTAFVLLTALPGRADRPVADHAKDLDVPTGVQRQAPSHLPAAGGLPRHPGTPQPTAQDRTPAATPPLPRPWWADALARRR